MKRRLGYLLGSVMCILFAGTETDCEAANGVAVPPVVTETVQEHKTADAVAVNLNNVRGNIEMWTLRRCIDYALENNVEIKKQELSVKDAELDKTQSRLNYIPTVNGSGGYSLSGGRVLDQTTYQFLESSTNQSMNASLGVGTELFAGMKKLHTMKRADLNLQSVLMQVEKARNDLSLNITAAYLDILFAQEQQDIAVRHVEILEIQVGQVDKLVQSGRKTTGDLLQLQAELAEARYRQVESDNNLTLAYFSLCQLLEIDDFRSFRVVVPEDMALTKGIVQQEPEAVIEQAQSMPEIMGAKINMDIAERNIKIARAELYPSLGFSAGYGSSYSDGRMKPDMNNPDTFIRYPFKEQIRDNASFNVSLSLNIPIFNGLSARNNIKSYKIAADRAQYDYVVAQKTLNRQIRQACLDAAGAYQQYEAAEKNVETGDESFRMVEQKYNLGAASTVDYGIALYNLVSARSQMSQAKFKYILKTKIIDFYRGIPIEL